MSVTLRSSWSDDRNALQPAGRGVGAAVVHHTVGSWSPGQDKLVWTRGLEHAVTDHVAPGNSSPLAALDYNELIFPDGDVVEGRGLGHEDAATYHYNGQSVSWALVGNYDVGPVPDVMLHALAGRIQYAISAGWLCPRPLIEGHRDVGTFATACPGRFMEARFGELRTIVSGSPEAAPPAPGEEDDLYTDADRARDKAAALRIQEMQNANVIDQLGWLGNWVNPGGYDARDEKDAKGNLKPSRLDSILAGVNKVVAKLGD